MSTPSLSVLARPSGAFAMLAIDQRESMRAMFADKQSAPVTDAQLTEFKVEALKVLTPYASAVLIDPQFAWRRAVAEGAVAPSCGLIAAADLFASRGDEIVGQSTIDPAVDPHAVKAEGGVAMKLLVIWRPDEDPGARIAMVDEFVATCRSAGLLSVVEPVSRRRRDGRACDLNAGILLAARELGSRGQDLYKAEVPHGGAGTESEVVRRCEELTAVIRSPWVVLSSGVAPDRFPTAVRWACRGGASGFLAGRAVWKGVIGAPDLREALRTDAIGRLETLCHAVDEAVTRA